MATFRSVENTGGLMAQGDYEVYVNSCKETTTKNGYPCIEFDFVVRSDVAQAYQNKHIFKKFFPDDMTGEYPAEKIGKYAHALGIEKGKEFELDDLIGRNCIVHISHYTGNDGQTRECIYYPAPSKCEAYMTDIAPAAQLDELDEDDGELPF